MKRTKENGLRLSLMKKIFLKVVDKKSELIDNIVRLDDEF